MSTATAPANLSPAPTTTTTVNGGSRVERKGNILVKWITTTDHKTIGYLYLITSFIYFCVGGVLALVIRAELFTPGLDVVGSNEQYNQLFTMHGTIMLLLFATPLFAGFANVAMPLQIGAPDVAFPKLNAFAYWLYFFGALITVGGFLTPQGAAAFGWTAYAPLTSTTFTPGLGGNLWVFGLALAGFGTILGAVNFITTIITMRAPGMTMFRMPIFTWNILVTSILVLVAFPVLAAALFALGGDRVFDSDVVQRALGRHGLHHLTHLLRGRRGYHLGRRSRRRMGHRAVGGRAAVDEGQGHLLAVVAERLVHARDLRRGGRDALPELLGERGDRVHLARGLHVARTLPEESGRRLRAEAEFHQVVVASLLAGGEAFLVVLSRHQF